MAESLEQVIKDRDQLVARNKELEELVSKLTIDKTKLVPTENQQKNKYADRIPVKKFVVAGAEKYIGQEVVVCGWVRTLRLQGGGKFAFVELNDGSSFKSLQLIVDQVETEGFATVEKGVGAGTSLLARGQIVKSPGNKQPVELKAKFVEVLGSCDAGNYKLAKGKLELDFLRSIAHLRPRTNTIGAVARVRNALAFATHKFFNEQGFLYVHTPLITAADCEGAGEMFQITTLLNSIKSLQDVPRQQTIDPATKAVVGTTDLPDYSKDFFGKPAYLTVSGQLNGETYACALSQIYTFGPTFRAENSHTTRHLAEFWMIEPEVAFADLQDNMNLAEAYLKYCIFYVLEHCPDELEFFNQWQEKGLIERLKHVANTPFQRITYTEAVDILIKTGYKFQQDVYWGLDLASEHERYLTEQVFKKPVIITNYPKDFKAFYMRLNEDGKTVAAMDILVPKIGEIIGGSQREERLEVLEKRLKEMDLPMEPYSWYLDLRRFGSVTHSGFGLGFERLVLFTTGIENIRDVIPFPRYPGHADF